MKKITSLLMGLVILAGSTFAQPKMKAKKVELTKVEQSAKPATKQATKSAQKMDPTAPSASPVKKDGTPDKRFKANKAEGPVKKDGTKDMRFKKNRMAVKKAA